MTRTNAISKLALLALSFTMLGGAKRCNSPSEPTSCVCAALLAPVCASDGLTYGNECEANCQGLQVDSQGECDYTLQGVGTSCTSSNDCNEGQSCLSYAGVTGQPLSTCHVDCAIPGEPGGGSAICPSALQCVSIEDGPGTVCLEIE